MNEVNLRALLHDCLRYDVAETLARAKAALAAPSLSKALRESTDETTDWLIDGARQLGGELIGVLRTPIWIIPNPLLGAYVARTNGEDDIVIHEATFQALAFVIWFWASWAKAGRLLGAARLAPEARSDVQKNLNEVFAVAVPLMVRSVVAPTRLPDLRAALTPAETDVAAGFLISAELFMLLHEQAHVDLGHMVGHSPVDTKRLEFALPEELNQHKVDELAADERAIESAPPAIRGIVAFGAVWFLMAILYTEAMVDRVSDEHPLAANRIRVIVDRYGSLMSSSDREFANQLMDFAQRTASSGQRFAHVPPEDRLSIMFAGRGPEFLADYVEFFFPDVNRYLAAVQQ